ncbi:prepilin-type N-terminal cleavage/methylation domain-containing protein [candidate division WWE3 bacterium]|nr:prepilin-type N-terminal cleavage/methylation domain-containing protein [candidate division WWE3 bacterium]
MGNNRGYTFVHLLIAIMILGLLSGAWWLWHKNQQTNVTSPTPTPSDHYISITATPFPIYITQNPEPTDIDSIPVPREFMCGGIANIQCPIGYMCQLENNYPDASGQCIPLTE